MYIFGTAGALKIQYQVPDHIWRVCVLTTTYIINRLPSSSLKGRTPFPVLFNQKPDYQRVRVCGCLCYMTNNLPHKGKFDSKAIMCIFLGYLFGQKGYKVMDLQSHSFRGDQDVVFVENQFPFHKELTPDAPAPLSTMDYLINTLNEEVVMSQDEGIIDDFSKQTMRPLIITMVKWHVKKMLKVTLNLVSPQVMSQMRGV